MTESVANEIISVTIEKELKHSYLAYAMSVIVGRALPDVRDGLKPVHRRILYAMSELGNDWNKPYKKSARIVGDVIGKYHPHGEGSIYDAIVRMAQTFSMRSILIDGQGNFGSVDGDSAAAMRYTEIRMSKLAHVLLADLAKETVDFAPNYDETEQIPTVLPTRIPNLLVNGSSGIAVGMATNIPPHNLGEVIDACINLLDDSELTVEHLMASIKGPDFPTAGLIYGKQGILEAYRSGRGRVFVRARTQFEHDERTNKQRIIINELPFQVNKAKLIEKIAELVKEKQIEGITALRDESDKEGMRVVIEMRRGENADVLLNNLFSQTQMQVTFGINMVALVDGRPTLFNLKQLIEAFLAHRREVVTRRTLYDLRKARERAHILEGLGIALANIDAMIALIKAAKDPITAKEQLLKQDWQLGIVADMLSKVPLVDNKFLTEKTPSLYGLIEKTKLYRLSPEQAQAILELRLHRLTGLEQDKILKEYRDQLAIIIDLLDILNSPERLSQEIRQELLSVREEFSDERRTEIVTVDAEISNEDLIPSEDVVVTLSHDGYVKRQSLDAYQAQRRGGRGKSSGDVKEEDFIEHLLIANTHATLLCFSSFGKVYWLKVYKLPEGSRTAKGRPIVNLLTLSENERIHAVLPVSHYSADHAIFMATANGTVKKTSLIDFSRPRNDGIIAIDLRDGDRLVGVALTDGQQDVLLFTDAGKVIRFNESKVRSMGRTACGVRGVKLQTGQHVISLIIAKPDGQILTATSNGYGKRTPIGEHRLTGRGGSGVVALKTTERNGSVVAAVQVFPQDEVMLITNKATLVRTRVEEIRSAGRHSQGVRLIRLNQGEILVSLERIEEEILNETV
ncbi:MAG: DNA gyrase subunit A [Rickettsiella sp.]|nr:DNA gyrase subunit A [Rickettsiella sp.]